MMVNLRQLIFYGKMVGINISKSMPTKDRTLLLQDSMLLYTKRALRLPQLNDRLEKLRPVRSNKNDNDDDNKN